MDSDAEFSQLSPNNWKIVGRILESSNNALIVENDGVQGVYKSVQAERPLWDFPSDTLSIREYQAFLIDRILDLNLIPSTLWINSDTLGTGIIQRYIPDAQMSDVRLISEDVESDDWVTIVKGEIGEEEIFLQHSRSEDIFLAAVFDAIINNSDRKAGHLLRDSDQKLWLIDHGVSFHEHDKLRTILWGWIGEDIPDAFKERLSNAFQNHVWRESWLLSNAELSAFERRISLLMHKGMPEPNETWPSLPSPIF